MTISMKTASIRQLRFKCPSDGLREALLVLLCSSGAPPKHLIDLVDVSQAVVWEIRGLERFWR
jgi:hypothetical protein